MAQEILGLAPQTAQKPLVLADAEHYPGEIFAAAKARPLDLLVPMKATRHQQARWQQMPPADCQRYWAGYALAKHPYRLGEQDGFEIVQRSGERPEEYEFKAFLSTRDREERLPLTADFPQRWQVEEFFKFDQALGWQRAGTLNLPIR